MEAIISMRCRRETAGRAKQESKSWKPKCQHGIALVRGYIPDQSNAGAKYRHQNTARASAIADEIQFISTELMKRRADIPASDVRLTSPRSDQKRVEVCYRSIGKLNS